MKFPFISSELIRNASVLISSNALGQLIALLATMLLTRIYSEEDFGIFALFMSVTTVLGYVATGKYEDAIVLTPGKQEATTLTGFIFRWTACFSLLLATVLFFFHKPLLLVLQMKSLNEFWMLIPLMVFLLALHSTLISLANREKHFKSIAGCNVTQNATSALSKALLNPLLPNAWGLIYGQLISYVCSFVSFFTLKYDLKRALGSRWEDQQKEISNYRHFPCYNLPRNVINSISGNLPFLMLTDVFGSSVLGLFFLAFTMSFRPINIVANSLYQVFYEKAAKLQRHGKKLSIITYAYWRKIFLFVLPLFVLIYLFAPTLFSFLFGNEWEMSGNYLRYILLWMFLILLTTPLGFIPLLFSKQKTSMWIEIFYFAFRIMAIMIGVHLKDFQLAILLFAATGVLFMSIQLLWYYRLINNYEKAL